MTLLAREKERLELEEQNQLKEEQRLQRVAALVQVGQGGVGLHYWVH